MLCDVDEGGVDGGVIVWVIVYGGVDDVSDFVEVIVVYFLKCVENVVLNGF